MAFGAKRKISKKTINIIVAVVFALLIVASCLAGYTIGKDDGYKNGKTDGYIDGKDAGFSEGYDAGYDYGYTEGKYDVMKKYNITPRVTYRGKAVG